MWERVLERFLNSMADALFWAILIAVIGYFIFRFLDFLTEDVDKIKGLINKKEEEE
jgi:uncharacterized membrane protein YedE/YeeE